MVGTCENTPDLYQALRVKRNASMDEISKAANKYISYYHPGYFTRRFEDKLDAIGAWSEIFAKPSFDTRLMCDLALRNDKSYWHAVANNFLYNTGAYVPKWATNVSMRVFDVSFADTYLVKPDCIKVTRNLDDRRLPWAYVPQDYEASTIQESVATCFRTYVDSAWKVLDHASNFPEAMLLRCAIGPICGKHQ